MRVVNRVPYLQDQFHSLPNGHRTSLDYFVQLAPFDEFHAEVTRAIALADFMYWNDTGMLEFGCRFGLETETFQVRFARPLAQANDF